MDDWFTNKLNILNEYKMNLIGICAICTLPIIDNMPHYVVPKIENEIYCKPCYDVMTRQQCLICNQKIRLYNLPFCNECKPNPYYIYTWTAPDEKLPFYVGMSKRPARLNELHFSDTLNTKLAKCELKRQLYENIIYSVVKDGLTQQEAELLEGDYYYKLLGMGAQLTNQVIPKQRKEQITFTASKQDISNRRFIYKGKQNG